MEHVLGGKGSLGSGRSLVCSETQVSPPSGTWKEVRSGNLGDLVLPRDVPLRVQAKVGARPPIYAAIR